MRLIESAWLFCSAIQAFQCPAWSQNDDSSAILSLILNKHGHKTIPRRFRASTDSFVAHFDKYRAKPHLPPLAPPVMIGYPETLMSGSSQMALHQIRKLHEKRPLVVVDLRMESHGFINGLPVSFFCPKNWDRLDVPLEALEEDETKRFKSLKSRGWAALYRKLPQSENIGEPQIVWFTTVTTQAEALAKRGIRYERVPIPDHRRPRDEQVTQLMRLFDSMSKQAHWMHFHCQAGKGRTTTAMIMRDMYLNADTLGLEDILHRNYIFSTIHLDDLRMLAGSYRRPFVEERTLFLRAFYQYCRHRRSHRQDWSSFLVAQLDGALYRAVVINDHWLTMED